MTAAHWKGRRTLTAECAHCLGTGRNDRQPARPGPRRHDSCPQCGGTGRVPA